MIYRKKLQQRTLVLIAALSLLMGACTKDPSQTTPTANWEKLSKIEYGDGSFEAIVYNANGTIGKITNSVMNNGTPQATVHTFVYQNGHLSEITQQDGSKYSYIYTGQNLAKIEYYGPGGNLVSYNTYDYKDGKLWKTDRFFRSPGSPGGISGSVSMRTEVEYYNNGNIKKTILYFKDPSSGVLEKTDEYVVQELDAKRNTTIWFENNPFIELDHLKGLNNPLSVLHYNGSGVLEETLTYTYTYDGKGHPLTRKTVTKIPGQADEVEDVRLYY